MTLPSQPVNYVQLNLVIRRLCLGNLIFSWFAWLVLYALTSSELGYSLTRVPIAAMGLSLFLSGVFAFGAVATNSISGQNRLILNLMPFLCILLSVPSVLFWLTVIEKQL